MSWKPSSDVAAATAAFNSSNLAISLTFRGDNDTHRITLDADRWQCNCHSFESWKTCAHVLALQKILGQMLPDEAQTSFFGAPVGAGAEAASA